MAEFSKLVLTTGGQALIAKILTGVTGVEFTRVCASSMDVAVDDLEALTELDGIMQESAVSNITRTNETAVKIEAAFTNSDLATGYYMRTLGLYANDPDDGEILYAATVETSGGCYMPAYNGVTVSGAYIELITTVGNAESVSLDVDATAIATIGDLKELAAAMLRASYDEGSETLTFSGGMYYIDADNVTSEQAAAIVEAGTEVMTEDEVDEAYSDATKSD